MTEMTQYRHHIKKIKDRESGGKGKKEKRKRIQELKKKERECL